MPTAVGAALEVARTAGVAFGRVALVRAALSWLHGRLGTRARLEHQLSHTWTKKENRGLNDAGRLMLFEDVPVNSCKEE